MPFRRILLKNKGGSENLPTPREKPVKREFGALEMIFWNEKSKLTTDERNIINDFILVTVLDGCKRMLIRKSDIQFVLCDSGDQYGCRIYFYPRKKKRKLKPLVVEEHIKEIMTALNGKSEEEA